MTVNGLSAGGVKLIGLGVIPVPLATAAVALRFLSRRLTRSIGADDYVMAVALLLYYGLYITMVVWAVDGYVGWPQDELTSEQLEKNLLTFFVTQIIYSLVGPATKLSILLLYHRIFAVMRRFIWAEHAVTALVLIWCISVLMAVIFECLPVGSYWMVNEKHHCIDKEKFYWGNGISNLLLDFIILCLPSFVIWRLQMTTRRKVSLTAVFMLGVFVFITSVFRIVYIWRLDFNDVSGTIVNLTIWTSFEPGFGIVTGCLPLLPPLFKKKRRHGAEERHLAWPTWSTWYSLDTLFTSKNDLEKADSSRSQSIHDLDDLRLVRIEDCATRSTNCHHTLPELAYPHMTDGPPDMGLISVHREVIMSSSSDTADLSDPGL